MNEWCIVPPRFEQRSHAFIRYFWKIVKIEGFDITSKREEALFQECVRKEDMVRDVKVSESASNRGEEVDHRFFPTRFLRIRKVEIPKSACVIFTKLRQFLEERVVEFSNFFESECV